MFLNDWAESGVNGLMCDFCIGEEELVGVEILFATYTYEDYSGFAYVLFQRDGKLYEVVASHCSCYGLEEQWEPEETTVEAVSRRADTAYEFEGGRAELRELLKTLS